MFSLANYSVTSTMSSLVKVSVEDIEGSDKKLHEFDKSKSLEENITDVCELFHRPKNTKVYALKLKSANDGKIIEYYISNENFNDIKDGYFLKLVFSVSYYVKTIFEHIDDCYKEKSFEDLYRLSLEPEFIKELANTENHFRLWDLFVNGNLSGKELTACLLANLHLLQKGLANEIITLQFLDKVISIVKSDGPREQVQYALSMLTKILWQRDPTFSGWKQHILMRLPLCELFPLMWNEDVKELQFSTLFLINSIIRCCKGEKRLEMIREIDLSNNRTQIFKFMIVPGNLDKNYAHELYVYQTYLLSKYTEPLNTYLQVDNNEEFERGEFEPDDEHKRMTFILDFDEDPDKQGVQDLPLQSFEKSNDPRYSLASMSSVQSVDSRDSGRTRTISNASLGELDFDYSQINKLTLEALRHYKRFYQKNFWQSQIEERLYAPGIFATSERVIKMLAKLLYIGKEPAHSSTFYQPLVFTCSERSPFILEMFSRTMWLLSKTRREMKASTLQDYEKVMKVLEKQVKLILVEKPMDLKSLTDKTVNISYDSVIQKWQKEKQEEMDQVIETHPCIRVHKKRYTKQNEPIVFQQRLNFMQKDDNVFPKILDKKTTGDFQARLSPNCKDLLIADYNIITKIRGETKAYSISDITHIVEGRACPHVMNNFCKDPNVAFSVIIKHDTYINFKAINRKVAAYWVDGLNLLLNKSGRSKYYIDELDLLVKTDLLLHLMELQNVQIPKKAPPVPPSPFEVKPPVAPKPKIRPKQSVS